MTSDFLKKTIQKLSPKPGVYVFKAHQRKYLYVGKATNLKSRLGSYLKTKDTKIKKMVESSRSLKFISTESDIEALILESQLIKKFRPRFNIVMRDDKQYFYVILTKEKFPKIFLSHQPCIFKYLNIEISHSIGPFTDGNTLKSTLRFLRRIFPYCTCKQLHNNFCLNYHIGKCPGFCCLKKPANSKQQLVTYKNNVGAIRNILNGKKGSLIKKFEKEMNQLAQKGDFEKAIDLRNKLGKLKRVFENARIISKLRSDLGTSLRSDLKKLKEILKIPNILRRIEGYDVSNIQGAHATGSMVTFVNGQPDKSFYRKFKIFKKKNISLRSDLNRTNDTAMLKEILERRFKHDEWPFPDLILIDGGKGQVNAARATLAALNITISVIGISKNEHHIGHQLIIPGRKSANWRTVPLNKLSTNNKNLLLAINSEAHRFAIGYYRKLHRRLFK